MKKTVAMVVFVAVVVGLVMPLSAEMYRYTDSKGQDCFVDDIAKVPRKYRKQARPVGDEVEVNTIPSPVVSTKRSKVSPPAPREEPSRRFTGTVELYAADWCPHCREAETYLRAKGIPYAKHDIEKDPAARRSFLELGGKGVPLILVGSHKMSGFSPESLEYYLNRQ